MLRTRVLTAVALAAALLFVLFELPPAAGIAVLALIVLVGAWEWARFAGLATTWTRLGYVLATALLCALAWTATRANAQWQALMAVAAAWWGFAFLWLSLKPQVVTRLATGLAGFWVLVPAWVGLARLLAIEAPVRGATLLFYMLLLVWATDVGGYFAGRRFGRLKLAPAVSPNKTWEGAIGGTLLALVVAGLGARWFGYPLLPFVALASVVVLSSMVGDLAESMFKRFAGLKDSGSLLPGHGGILDRIDSITAAVPFFVLGLFWLGIVG